MHFGVGVFGVKVITRDDSQRRFLAQHIVPTLLELCFDWLQTLTPEADVTQDDSQRRF